MEDYYTYELYVSVNGDENNADLRQGVIYAKDIEDAMNYLKEIYNVKQIISVKIKATNVLNRVYEM